MKLSRFAAVFAACFVAGGASASIVTDLIGDKDGLGLGLTDGDGFRYTDVGSGDGDGTDVWRLSDYTYSHTYSLAGLGALTSASLEIAAGGIGFSAVASVLVNGTLVGTLTDGDDVGPAYNYYFVDMIDLASVLGSLDGADSVTIDVVLSGDGWALDYSELTVTGTSAAVPLPASLALMLGGLGALGVARRRAA